MSKVNLTGVADTRQPSAAGVINANSDLLEVAIENTLSRDGTSPNEMESSLDMNSNKIINLPAATTDTEPLRKSEWDKFVTTLLMTGEVTLPGVAGAVVTNNNGVISVTSGDDGQVLRANDAGTSPTFSNLVDLVDGGTNITVSGTNPATVSLAGTVSPSNGGTGLNTYTIGDVLYSGNTNSLTKLAGNTTTTRKFLKQAGNGSASAAPAWDTIQASDVPGVASAVDTMAALRALTPGVTNNVRLRGFYAVGDGGEGDFYWNSTSTTTDNLGTVIQPNAGGTGRWIRFVPNNKYSVRWFGAMPDGVTNYTTQIQKAADVAVAAKGTLYFPAGTSFYLGSILLTDKYGFNIEGDSADWQLNGTCSCLIAPFGVNTLDLEGTASPTIGGCEIKNMRFATSGSGAHALKLYNTGNFLVQNVLTQGVLGIYGAPQFTLQNVAGYGSPALRIKGGPSPLTGCGPGKIVASTFNNSGSAHTGAAIEIDGEVLSICFDSCGYNWNTLDGTFTGGGAITIDGLATAGPQGPEGSVTFIECHGESLFNGTNTGCDFLIGGTHKFGTVRIIGGNSFGHGDGVRYQRDWLRVGSLGAVRVEVGGAIVSKLNNANGYNRAMVRLDTAPDNYSFRNLDKLDINGTLFDGGTLTGFTGTAISGTSKFDLASLGNAVTNAVLYTNSSGIITPIVAGTNGQVPVGTTGSPPTFRTVSGDATLGSTGTLTLGSTITAGGPTGSSTTVPVITYDDKGRLTAVTTASVTSNKLNAFASTTSSELAGTISDETGTGSLVFATSPALVTPNLGTPSAATLTNATGLPVSTGISGLGTGVATFLATPSSANLASAVTNETGSGALVFGTSPTLTTPIIGSIVNTGTLTLPTSTDTLVGKATTDTLTNKTVNLTSNTLTGTTAQFNTALSDNDFATLAGSEALTNKTYNGNTWTAGTGTLAVGAGKTATISNTLTFTGTDSTTVPFGSRTRQVFTTGSGTYTTPANVKHLFVRMVGGGGGSTASGTSPGAGTAGGNTTFSTFTANGGVGATGTSAGSGGTGSGGTLNLTGGTGQGGVLIANSPGGNGGISFFGGSGWGGSPTNNGTAATANTGSGAGGGGSAGTALAGAGGGSGAYVEGVITSPAATYSYGVGAGGAGGTLGTGGSGTSAAGGAGLIIVEEFYT